VKTCSRCTTNKPIDDFYWDITVRGGRRSDCKECHKATSRRRYAENPNQAKANARNWSQANRLRSNELKLAWKKRQNV
jgi:hypothetical protein